MSSLPQDNFGGQLFLHEQRNLYYPLFITQMVKKIVLSFRFCSFRSIFRKINTNTSDVEEVTVVIVLGGVAERHLRPEVKALPGTVRL